MKIARRMDGGESLGEIVAVEPREERTAEWLAANPYRHGYSFRLRTPAEAKRATLGATLESATDACWAILQLLPREGGEEGSGGAQVPRLAAEAQGVALSPPPYPNKSTRKGNPMDHQHFPFQIPGSRPDHRAVAHTFRRSLGHLLVCAREGAVTVRNDGGRLSADVRGVDHGRAKDLSLEAAIRLVEAGAKATPNDGYSYSGRRR